mgnify:CR=1 FL=1
MMFKVPEDRKLALVKAVGAESPIVGHINHPHMFKTEEVAIGRAGKFAAHNTAYGAGLADQVGLLGDGRKAEACLVPAPRGEGKTSRNTRRMICRLTRVEPGPTCGGEAAIGERTTKGVISCR